MNMVIFTHAKGITLRSFHAKNVSRVIFVTLWPKAARWKTVTKKQKINFILLIVFVYNATDSSSVS